MKCTVTLPEAETNLTRINKICTKSTMNKKNKPTFRN